MENKACGNISYFPRNFSVADCIDIKSVWFKKTNNIINISGVDINNLVELLEKLVFSLQYSRIDFQVDDVANPFRDMYIKCGSLPINFLSLMIPDGINDFNCLRQNELGMVNSLEIKQILEKILYSNYSFIVTGTSNCDIWPKVNQDKRSLLVTFENGTLTTQKVVCCIKDDELRAILEKLITYIETTDNNLKNIDVDFVLENLRRFIPKQNSLVKVKNQ